MKLFHLLLAAALVAAASAACTDCEAAANDVVKPLTCTSATVALTCPALSVLTTVADKKSCVKCSANTSKCTAGTDFTQAKSVSTECNAGFGVKATTVATCAACTAASTTSGSTTKQATKCTIASNGDNTILAADCPSGSVKNGAVCTECKAGAVTCTKGADGTNAKTVATKCAASKYIKAGTSPNTATCETCATITCGAGKKTKAVTQCAAGTSTADATTSTDCEACSPNAATCETTLQKGAKTCDTGYQLNDSATENCASGKFGEKVKVCVATCADADKTKITAAGGCMCDTTLCAKDKACNDKTCADPVTKKSPASTLQASALLSAAALLVALRQ